MSRPGVLEPKEQLLRASSGNGEGGGYSTIARPPPALAAAAAALRAWLRPPPSEAQAKALLLRYGAGGVNWAHQDQNSSPWQAVLLLNPPAEFDGGALYVLDAAAAAAAADAAAADAESAAANDAAVASRCELPFGAAGDAIVFAANSTAYDGARHLYHGMTLMTRGRRFAVGMFQ
eukprot:Transcript_24535.p3 GENE.Transcript_24535~~Transcript_24535.p3  ORF type:complete len:176 (-),score=73.98 Transcript_24535:55-582(-)